MRRYLLIQRRFNRERGFSLIELLIAVSLLSFGLLAVASLLMTAIAMNSIGRSGNDANALARDKIEKLKLLPATDPQRAVGGSLTANVSGYNDLQGIYRRRWQIAAGPAGTRIYTVRIIPVGGDGRISKEITMSTIF